MSGDHEGLLTDVANAIGATLGQVASTTTQLARTAKRKVSGRGTPQRKKRARRAKIRARATTAAARRRVSGKASRSAKRTPKSARRNARRKLRAA